MFMPASPDRSDVRPTSSDVLRPAAMPDVDRASGPTDPLVALLATLRASTTRFARGLRADGVPEEQVVVRVEAFVREAMAAEGWQDPGAVEALTSAVVGWSIAACHGR
jgi:hypothetical protein